MGRGSFSGGMGMALTTPANSAEVKDRIEVYLYSLFGPLWLVLGWIISFTLLCQTLSNSLRTKLQAFSSHSIYLHGTATQLARVTWQLITYGFLLDNTNITKFRLRTEPIVQSFPVQRFCLKLPNLERFHMWSGGRHFDMPGLEIC